MGINANYKQLRHVSPLTREKVTKFVKYSQIRENQVQR